MNVQEFGVDLLARLLDHVVQVVPEAVGAGLVLGAEAAASAAAEEDDEPRPPGRARHARTEDGELVRLAAAAGVAVDVDEAQLACGRGPVWSVLGDQQAVILPGPAAQAGGPASSGPVLGAWPELTAIVDEKVLSRVRGLVLTPGEWGGPLPAVLTTYLAVPATAAHVEQLDGLEALVSQAVAVVEYCAGSEIRSRQMLEMIQYRRVIEQAKGLVIAALGGDGPAAFGVLSRASQHFNVRLRALAIALVEHVGQGEAEHPEDPSLVVRPNERERTIAASVWTALRAGSSEPR